MVQLLVTGTRYGRADVPARLDLYVRAFGRPSRLIVGGDLNRGVRSQRGVDEQVATWARHYGIALHTEYADWTNFGGGAGPERNSRMVALCQTRDHCLAFPHVDPDNQRGTRDCFTKAQIAGLFCWWL